MPDAQRIEIIVGHYGSGKTNLAVNLALERAQQGRPVSIVDLDIVNPYFRAADFDELFSSRGVRLVKPMYANTNLDIPAINFDLERLLEEDGDVIIDVGGDDAGATALGRYSALLNARQDKRVCCVVNCYRYLTAAPEETAALLRDIELASHVRLDALINNANLGSATTPEDVERSESFCEALSALTELPVAFPAVRRDFVDSIRIKGDIMPIDIYVKPLWEHHI